MEDTLKLLTRAEELILLSVWKLKENAYCVPIRAQISEITGENWSLGSIYMPLDRLVKKGYLRSRLSDSTPERGGRHKRIYQLTDDGMKALMRIKQIQASIWQDVPESFNKI